MTFGYQVTQFLFHLHLPFKLPGNTAVLSVHQQPEVQKACTDFYNRFFSDTRKRHLLIGINPGRFGGGVTGIPFTDPIRLEQHCGIPNPFPKKQELSSAFIYDMIAAYGGVERFYNRFYISAVSPLGFTSQGKNLNYYDDKLLMKRIEPFVADCMERQLEFGIDRGTCFCIGEGENLKYLTRMNDTYKWFGSVQGLPHPRYIMQYKLKLKEAYINRYTEMLLGIA